VKRAVLLVGVAALCIGWGGTQVRTVTVRSTAQPHHCVGLTGYSISGYELCDSRTFRFAGRLIDVARPPGSPSGIWIDGFVAPDAKTLLVQWSAECETPYAFFVPTRGGVPRLVTGERSMKNAPISIADG